MFMGEFREIFFDVQTETIFNDFYGNTETLFVVL